MAVINAARARQHAPSGLLLLWQTSIGKKLVMALSGVILFGYVVLHLWGNLKVFSGAQALNNWGTFLRQIGDPLFAGQQVLWIVRVILLAALVLHVVAAIQLTRRDYASRPIGYATRRNLQSSYASRSMRWGGILILLFVIYHILDLTTGTLHPASFAAFEEGNIYGNVMSSFQVWWNATFYIAAVSVLGMHLYHGLWSAFQTLGLNSSRSDQVWRTFAIVFAVAITIGNVAIPASVLLGLVR